MKTEKLQGIKSLALSICSVLFCSVLLTPPQSWADTFSTTTTAVTTSTTSTTPTVSPSTTTLTTSQTDSTTTPTAIESSTQFLAADTSVASAQPDSSSTSSSKSTITIKIGDKDVSGSFWISYTLSADKDGKLTIIVGSTLYLGDTQIRITYQINPDGSTTTLNQAGIGINGTITVNGQTTNITSIEIKYGPVAGQVTSIILRGDKTDYEITFNEKGVQTGIKEIPHPEQKQWDQKDLQTADPTTVKIGDSVSFIVKNQDGEYTLVWGKITKIYAPGTLLPDGSTRPCWMYEIQVPGEDKPRYVPGQTPSK